MEGQNMEEPKPLIGDTVRVELSDGREMTGTFEYHGLAGDCILNQYGFPIRFKRIIEIME